ncbi:N-lysine methyltransferase KMT5A [Agrilus planipennis]|uniref:[histone H4]-lysine(20) N-methyltransferase n=1 Tax=Agrilus planipennis TaxID=224129 RepID=A0A7F5RNR2_AGRPL|nr:N-lysine methyltransferase KMT5A [Agrilus planipennis]
MVRGRRVKAIESCRKPRECCSPKRKDQRLDDKVIINNRGNITNFFKTTDSINEIDCEINDKEIQPQRKHMTLRKNHQFQVQVDLLTKVTSEILNGQDVKLKKTEKEILLSKKPATPHRIVACTDLENQGFPKDKKLSKKRLNDRFVNNSEIMKHPIISINPKDDQNHKLTDFFPVRRSVRKTKKTVLEEKQRDLENILRKNIEEGLKVHIFEEKGRGVVTTKPFKRGDFVVEYSGELIDMSEAKRREEEYAEDQNTGCYMYYFCHKNKQFCVDATAETGRLGRLVNHSRNGNLITRTVSVDGVPRLILVAKEDISTGEELTYDYGDRSKESLKYHPWLAY